MKGFLQLLIILLGFTFQSKAQNAYEWTAEDNGYLYHMVKKSPILNANLGQYFVYIGPQIKYIDNSIDYDSIENIIINQPEKLIIYKDEIAKASKGLLAEAANKMALWKLNRILLAQRQKIFKTARDEKDFLRFQNLLIKNLPESLLKVEDGKVFYSPRLEMALNPSLTFDDKQLNIATLDLSPEAQVMTMNAINYAINQFVEDEARSIFNALGGKSDVFTNVLVAAGDGSSTSGMLEEREKDEKGRYNKGLPKAVGLFPYVPVLVNDKDSKGGKKMESQLYSVSAFKTVGLNKNTSLHFDVWGYNTEKQTTVVVEKNGKTYHLFGSGETRFLTPDSSFQKGTTYKDMMNILENKMIAELSEKIYGKKGFDSEIEYHKKMRDEAKLELDNQSKDMFETRANVPIYTKSKGKGGRKNRNAGKAKTNTISGRKKRKKRQELYIQTQNKYDFHLKRISEVEKEKKEAMKTKGYYETEWAKYNLLLGINWVEFTEKDGLYTYADSTTFDIFTQEFVFPPKAEVEEFEVRLLAIPNAPLSKQADEVMMHINLVDAKQNYRSKINLENEDAFASDMFTSNKQLLRKELDSIGLKEFFLSLIAKDGNLEIIARGQGVGEWNGSKTVKNRAPKELLGYPKYPGSTESMREDSIYKRLRKTELFLSVDRGSFIEINSYTDPVKSNVVYNSKQLKDMALKYQFSSNDVLSVLRTVQLCKNLRNELNILAGNLLSREDAKKVIDLINKEFERTRITINAQSIKLSDLLETEKFF